MRFVLNFYYKFSRKRKNSQKRLNEDFSSNYWQNKFVVIANFKMKMIKMIIWILWDLSLCKYLIHHFEYHKKSLCITRLQICLFPEHLHHPSHHAGPKHITQDEVSPKQLVLLILTCNLHWLLECSNLKNLQSTPSYSAQKIFNSLWSRFLQFKKSHCQVTVEMCTPWSPGNYWQENLETRHKALGSSRKWKQLLPEIMQLEKLERAK